LSEPWVSKPVRLAFEAAPFERLTRDEDGFPLTQTTNPELMARMLVGLQVEPGASALEIGTGSGYNAALLSELVGEGGRVVSIEVSETVSADARRRLLENGYGGVRLRVGDGWGGYAANAPYDRIIATTKPSRIPESWVLQLKPGGILVTPIDHPRSPTGTVVAYYRNEGGVLALFDGQVAGFIPMTRTDDEEK
jgi:protein-L-isoaspartate(D-aspartate) O-methyltransferase